MSTTTVEQLTDNEARIWTDLSDDEFLDSLQIIGDGNVGCPYGLHEAGCCCEPPF